LLTAAKLALADGGLEDVDCGADAGLFLSHENPGVMQFVEKFAFDIYELLCDAKKLGKKVFLNKIYEKHAENIFDLQGFVFLFKIAKALNLHGLSLITNNACSSGLYSLEVASETIRNGHNEMALVVAVDRPDVFKYWWFKKLGIYSATGVISPFSEEANGFVFGEGGGGVLLEDYNHALKRGAKIYAEYLGGAFSLEGWKVVLPNTNKDSYKKMLISMLNRCGISSSEVDLVVPHGVGASVIDRYEATALEQVFGKNKKNIKPFYTAFKPFFGHCLGGSSLLEAILLILALKNEEIPPTLNYGKPSRKIGISFVDDFLKMKIKIAVKSSAAFAGFDASVAFKRIDDEF